MYSGLLTHLISSDFKVEDGVYTSETRGSDESGEGTYRVPFKTVMKVNYLFLYLMSPDAFLAAKG